MLEKINKINPITNKERYVEMSDLTLSSNKLLRFNPISKEYYSLKYKIVDNENDKNNKNLNL